MLILAAAAVELPFLAACLLVQLLYHCPHCRHEWLSWPLLPGVVPWYFATYGLGLVPRTLTEFQLRCGFGAWTVCLIFLVAVLSWRNAHWRRVLAVGAALSIGLALLAFLMLAA